MLQGIDGIPGAKGSSGPSGVPGEQVQSAIHLVIQCTVRYNFLS